MAPIQQQLKEVKNKQPRPTLCERILALPQELIDIIKDKFHDDPKLEYIPKGSDIVVFWKSCRIPSVLQVNRALREKYREQYYTLNRFCLLDNATNHRWCASLSDHYHYDRPHTEFSCLVKTSEGKACDCPIQFVKGGSRWIRHMYARKDGTRWVWWEWLNPSSFFSER